MTSTDRNTDRRTDRAVSPVIGVILMVAITVILAAVIGTFVLDLGQDVGNSAPQASLSVGSSTTSDNVTISHSGGDSLDLSETQVIIREESSDSIVRLGPNGTSVQFSVGDKLEIILDHSVNRLNGDGNTSGFDDTGSAVSYGFTSLTEGNKYTVTVVDTASDKQVFKTTFTA